MLRQRAKNSLFWLSDFFLKIPRRQSAGLLRAGAYLKKRKALILSLLAAFAISDLALIESHRLLLPEKKPPAPPLPRSLDAKRLGRNFYQALWEQNIFHTGPLPGSLTKPKEEPQHGEPVKSSLPFDLKGLIIHANSARSVASIHDRMGVSAAYSEGDFIERKGSRLAKITGIQMDRVVFLNLKKNSRPEYILMPEKIKLSMNYGEPAKKPPPLLKDGLVKREGSRMTVKRSDVEEHLKRFSQIVREAGVVPHRAHGEVEGYRFAFIKKGSIFEELGFQKGDILKEVDGETVTSPQQGFELFQRLRTSSGFKILAERDGEPIEYEYSVNEDAPIGESLHL